MAPLSLHDFPRAILHIDGDAFFASCEQSRRPKLQGRPVVTGKERGIAASMSYERAIACLRQTLTSLEGTGRHEHFGQVILPAVGSRAWLAVCHAELGMFAEGRAFGEQGLRIAEAMEQPAGIMRASWGVGLLSLRQGDLPRALPRLEQAVHICQDADLPAFFPWLAAALGETYILAGRIADAVPLLTQALEQTTARASIDLQALCLLPLGEAHVRAGRLEEAHALAEHTLALTRRHQERGNEAYALHLLGDITAQREILESDQAGEYYRQALALAEKLEMRPLQAHCHRSLGTWYTRADQHEQAVVALSTAIAMYQSMDMTLWLPQTEVALAQVEGR